jgi:hypothetical protein
MQQAENSFRISNGEAIRHMSIQVSFIPEDREYTIDTVPTDFKKEYLYDENGWLTIKKTWDCSKERLTAASLKTYLIASYPTNFEVPLITLKISELKSLLADYADQLDFDEVKKHKSSAIRQAIYGVTAPSSFKNTAIPIDKDEGKKIWDALKSDLPLFFLFQSDRANKDSDKEVQDPLKAITKTAISQLETELEAVKDQIKIKAEELGNHTLAKLKEMNPEIADVLRPEMSNKAWDSLFSFSFTCDDGIPINKRGSGVRRLILLNYFRAEAERQNTDGRNVIYAIEEPETSQHPTWQVELFNALIALANSETTQIVTTTHSPSLAGLVKTKSIRFIHREDDSIRVTSGDNADLEEITRSLGLLPDVSISVNDLSIKAILCLEGPTDVEFFNHVGKIFGLDLERDDRILTIFLGGGTLKHWVNKNYLRKLNKPEIHIYDSDVATYQATVDEVNQRAGCWAARTRMFEVENYIHPSLIKHVYPITEDFVNFEEPWLEKWATANVPKELSAFLKELKRFGNTAIREEGSESIKRIFSEKAARLMTEQLLRELNAYDEVEEWFARIKSAVASN